MGFAGLPDGEISVREKGTTEGDAFPTYFLLLVLPGQGKLSLDDVGMGAQSHAPRWEEAGATHRWENVRAEAVFQLLGRSHM